MPEQGTFKMVNLFRRFGKKQNGGTAVEYSLVAALIAGAAIGGIEAYGEALQNMFLEIAGTIQQIAEDVSQEI